MLAADSGLRAMRVDGDQSEQGIQIEMRQRSGMRAKAQIAFRQKRL